MTRGICLKALKKNGERNSDIQFRGSIPVCSGQSIRKIEDSTKLDMLGLISKYVRFVGIK